MHKNHFWLRLFFHSLRYRPGAAGSGNLSRALAASLLFAADQWGWFYSTFWAFRRVSPRRRGCCRAAFAGTDEHRRGFEKERREGRVALPKGSASEQQSELWVRNSSVPCVWFWFETDVSKVGEVTGKASGWAYRWKLGCQLCAPPRDGRVTARHSEQSPTLPLHGHLWGTWAHVGTVSVMCFWHSFWLVLHQFGDFFHLKDNCRTLLGNAECRG